MQTKDPENHNNRYSTMYFMNFSLFTPEDVQLFCGYKQFI